MPPLATSQRLIAGLASVLVMIFIVDLVRRRKLREEYSILWLAGGLVMLIAAVQPATVSWVARLLSITHEAYGIFVMALFVGLILAIHFTVVLSKLTAQTWRLTQEIGLIRHELEEVKRGHENQVASD